VQPARKPYQAAFQGFFLSPVERQPWCTIGQHTRVGYHESFEFRPCAARPPAFEPGIIQGRFTLSRFAPILTFPAVILPAFICAALLLAILLHRRRAEIPWRYRDILAAFSGVLVVFCAMLAMEGIPRPQAQPADKAEASIEVDMLAASGRVVELWLNDWQHPSEQVPIVAGQRHVYRFRNVPREITLLRLDPSDERAAKIVIYSIAVKSAGRIVQQFDPAELKAWSLVNLSPPQEDKGALTLLATTDDPIVWTRLHQPLILHPSDAPPSSPLWRQWLRIYSPFLLAFALLLLLLLTRVFHTGRMAALLNRPIPSAAWLLWLVALAAAGSTIYVQQQNVGSDLGVDVDMRVSRGQFVELWANDWQHDSERHQIIEGQRYVYHFARLPQHLTLLRLDPTDLADAKVVIYGITIKAHDRTFQQFGPDDLKRWTFVNFSPPRDEDGGLAFDDTNDDPSLWTPLALRLPGSTLQAALATLVETSDAPFLLAIAAFLLVLLTGMAAHTGRLQAVLIALTGGVACPLVLLVMRLRLSPPRVTSVVGYASYRGYSKTPEHLASLALFLTCIALGYAFAKLARRGNTAMEDVPVKSPANSHRRPSLWIVHAAVFALLLLYFLPNVQGVLVNFPGLDLSDAHGTNLEFVQSLSQTRQQHVQWDAANVLTWTYMLNAGLRPLRDFWFPYTGWYLQLLPFPMGPVTLVVHCALLLWILYWCLFCITGRRLGQALTIFGLSLAPVLVGMAEGWDRYLVAVAVALFYVVICETRLEWKTHAPFAALVGWAFFFEPTQVIYAGAGIAAHIAVAVLSRFQGDTLRQRLLASAGELRQRLLRIAIPLLSGIAAALLLYAGNGMLAGFWDLEKSLGDIGDYGAVPADIVRWVLPMLQPDSVFLLVFLLLSYAVYRSVKDPDHGRTDPLGTTLVVLCGLAYMAMQKQIVRPHIMTQVRIYPYIATLIFGLIVWRERKPAARIVMAAFIGCMLGIAIHRGELREIVRQDVEQGPGKVSRTVHALLNENEFAKANARLYSRVNLAGFTEENAVVDNLVQSCGLRPSDTVYVLGDDSLFYIVLNQQPPYNINSYNESPIYEQQKVLDWFQRKIPRFVIWAPEDSSFDGVPHVVRLPLVYTYVVDHYDFVRAVGPFHILTARQPNQPPNLDYWRRTLGDRVDLGNVPARARLSEYTPCGGDTTRCDPVLVVHYPQPAPVPRAKATIDIESFRLQFDVTPGQREYVVNLNRLWFWKLLSAPRITPEDPVAQSTVDYRTEPHPVLY
jgi:hypothetical protein